MRLCFSCLLLCAAVVSAAAPEHRISTVVRSDSRTGRLVRRVVVTPKVQPPAEERAVTPVTTAASGIEELVEATAKEHGVDPLLVHSVIKVESAYNPYAISHKGAQGLMQLMPATARRFGVRNVFNPEENVKGGVRYLRYLQDLYRNDNRLTLAAYNAGEGAVARYGDVPPYRETVSYVSKVGKNYGEAKRRALQSTIAQQPAAPPAAPQFANLEAVMDETGRVYLRTR